MAAASRGPYSHPTSIIIRDLINLCGGVRKSPLFSCGECAGDHSMLLVCGECAASVRETIPCCNPIKKGKLYKTELVTS